MAFVTGLLLIDAPASALNNGEGEDTKAKVKSIRVRGQGEYPYVSAQSFRYWLRNSIEAYYPEWISSEVKTGGAGKKQQAFTEGNPVKFWDDDLLGYMRAEKAETVTRVSPFRTSTLVSLSPVNLVDDFGVMARVKKEEGDKEGVLLHGHEFYRTVLKGLFSLDLSQAGTFSNKRRTGFQNLTKEVSEQAQQHLAYDERYEAYRLPIDERIRRVQTLISALGRVEGGAKQTLHYTDVNPAFVILAVTRGGNHAFGRVVQSGNDSNPVINQNALQQVLDVFGGDLLSPIYVGRAEGFMDSSADVLNSFNLPVGHPREALDALANEIASHPEWLD